MEVGNRELLAAAATGDQPSWDELVRRFNSLLWAIARSFRLAQPEDAVQNTWLRLVENLDGIADPDRLPGWLATTARRECLQLLRREARYPAPEPVEPLVDLPATGPAVDADLLLAERDARLWRAVEELAERCRRLLRVLMASPPPPYAAVATALGMEIGSIGPTRQRCLRDLRVVLERDPRFREAPDE